MLYSSSRINPLSSGADIVLTLLKLKVKDFTWSGSIDFAKTIGLLEEDLYFKIVSNAFIRDYVAKSSYDAYVTVSIVHSGVYNDNPTQFATSNIYTNTVMFLSETTGWFVCYPYVRVDFDKTENTYAAEWAY